MKKPILFILFTVLYPALFAQSFRAKFLNPNVYRTRTDFQMIRIANKDYSQLYSDTFSLTLGGRRFLDYKIVRSDDAGHTIIRILPKICLSSRQVIDSATGKSKTEYLVTPVDNGVVQYVNDSANAYNYYFAVKSDKFPILSKTLMSEKIVGLPLVQPLKLRPSKGTVGWDLSGEFTVSYNFGWRMKLGDDPYKQNFLTLVGLGFGVGSAKYFTEDKDGMLTEKKDGWAITYYQAGVLLTIEKVNFGLFTGFDAMIDKQNDWFYQGRQWYSFGIGYKFKTD
jgi:hypothetical protein